jgi:hypothetical protein
MAIFTVRMTEENGNPIAWIDREGQICIMQPHAPEQAAGSVWDSYDAALAWANTHAQEMETREAEALAAVTAKQEAKASALAKLAALGLTQEEIEAL